MDMREESVKMYQTVKTEYALSAAVPMSDLGMMRVFYRQGSYDQVANQYAELNKPGAPDSLLAHANYIMGETELARGEYRQALQYFSIIPESHPAYVLPSIPLQPAHALLNSGMHMVAASLENCVSAEVKDPAEKRS
jgi:tetratricopeptide (TPR) repeat protein